MAPKSLELKVISCKDIKAFNFFQKLSIYASVSLVNTKKSTEKHQQQKTSVDREGDGNPEWKHQMKFDLHQFSSLDSLFVEFELLSEGLVFDKSIAHVRVPMKELVDGSNGGALRFVSYQAVTVDGVPNGVLDFSYKVFDDMPATNLNLPTPMPDRIYPSDSNQFYYPQQDQGVYPPPPSVYPPPPEGSPFGYPPPPAVSPLGYPPPLAASPFVYPPPPAVYPPPMPNGQEFHSQACYQPGGDQFRPYYDDSWQKDVQPWNVR
ncbi:hypothetical protein ACHQM5_025958 [Ranunculus cassubicifolius]